MPKVKPVVNDDGTIDIPNVNGLSQEDVRDLAIALDKATKRVQRKERREQFALLLKTAGESFETDAYGTTITALESALKAARREQGIHNAEGAA